MQITHSTLRAIRRQLEADYPAEGCGFLFGSRPSDDNVFVRGRFAVPNDGAVDGTVRNRYFILPDDFRRAERAAKASGLELVGVYHSHPDVAARPSSYDREHAWPWLYYLIVSVVKGAVREERVWELADDRNSFIEHALQVEGT